MALRKLNVMIEMRPTNYILDADIIVYADDFVCCFQNKEDAEEFYERLRHRVGHFGLELEESKSRLIEFGRYAEERCRKDGNKPRDFYIPGFHTLLFQKQGRKVQSEEENQQEEVRKEM